MKFRYTKADIFKTENSKKKCQDTHIELTEMTWSHQHLMKKTAEVKNLKLFPFDSNSSVLLQSFLSLPRLYIYKVFLTSNK